MFVSILLAFAGRLQDYHLSSDIVSKSEVVEMFAINTYTSVVPIQLFKSGEKKILSRNIKELMVKRGQEREKQNGDSEEITKLNKIIIKEIRKNI